MGDVAQILAPTGATGPSVGSSNCEPSKYSSADSTRALEISGMSKDAMSLLKGKQDPNSASLPPVVPTFTKLVGGNGTLTERNSPDDKDGSALIRPAKKSEKEQQEIKVKVGSKWVSSSKRARPWAWAPFASSSRTDGAMFRHWVRKNVEYTDYPYAKFDIHMDPVTYTSEEYAAHLQSETWTRSETDRLMELARIFECRWPVIFDRFCFENGSDSSVYNHTSDEKGKGKATASSTDSGTIRVTGVMAMRKIEDLQHRYYGVAATLAQIRIAQEAASEARALSVAAAKSASAAITPVTNAIPTPAAVPSAITSTPSTTPSPTDRISSVVAQQERTDNLLLESAAARSLATSAKHHQPLIAHVGTGTSNKMFDYLKEQERRQHLDRLWRRSKEEEDEELELRKELKTIDAQLRKLKKNGGHILAAGKTKTTGKTKTVGTATASRAVSAQSSSYSNQGSNAPSSRGPSRSTTPLPSGASSSTISTTIRNNGNKLNNNSAIIESSDVLDEYFASTAPVPMSQYPYLQSGRLLPPATGGSSGINKSLLARMNVVLSELSIPERPIPTKRVCDLYDIVRKDILILLTLKKNLMQKEGQLQSKRLRLSKMGGSILAPEDKILDEERLLGIAPPPKISSTATTGGSSSASSKGKASKRKITGGTGGKSKVAPKKNVIDSKNVTSTTTKKKTVKRKRKTDTGKIPNPFPSNISSKSLAHGSVASKATKVRPVSSTAAVSNVPPKSTTAHRVGAVASNSSLAKNAIKGAAVPHSLTQKTPAEAVAPKAKPSTASMVIAPTATEKANNESAAKRSRKS